MWPNKRLVVTMPARRNFCICARYYGLGSGIGFVLPLRALAWPHKRGVSPLLRNISYFAVATPPKLYRQPKHEIRWPLLPVRLERLSAHHHFSRAHRQRNTARLLCKKSHFRRASHRILDVLCLGCTIPTRFS